MVHDRLTICSVVGHNDGAAAIPSICQSLEQLPGSQGLLISPARPNSLPAGILWRQTAPLSYKQYSIFVMHCLQAFIKTDYCLIVQDDGWVLSGENFHETFYAYDYVGAPCHAALIGKVLKQRYSWVRDASRIVIQNGGFSLRSRKFLQAPSEHGLAYIPDTRRPLFNEDIQLSGTLRPRLEQLGYKYAPDEHAMHFAIEYLGPIFHDNLDLKKIVGHHATTRKLIGPGRILSKLTPVQVSHSFGESRVLSHLESLGYCIEFDSPVP